MATRMVAHSRVYRNVSVIVSEIQSQIDSSIPKGYRLENKYLDSSEASNQNAIRCKTRHLNIYFLAG